MTTQTPARPPSLQAYCTMRRLLPSAVLLLVTVGQSHAQSRAEPATCMPASDVVSFCRVVLEANRSLQNATAPTEPEEWLSGFPHGKPPLLQAHIYCMFLAAPLWFATAAVTAFGRFTSWWMQIHITLAISTLVVTLGGIACIVVFIETEGSGHFRTTHHIVGILLGSLLVLHITLAAARPKDPIVRDIYGKADSAQLTVARRAWHFLHTVTGFPVLGCLFMFQVLYSGHVTLHGYWAFPLNFLFFLPVVVLKNRLESGAAELKEQVEEDALSAADATNPLAETQPEELVACPDITANIEWMFANRATGALSPAFMVALVSCGQFIPHLLNGSFIMPSLGEAYEARDPLMCFGSCFLMLFTSIAVPLWLVEVRRSINPVIDGGPGYLKQLGVGTLMITPRQARSIRAAGHFHPYNPKAAPPNLLPPIVVCLFVGFTGWGARSAPWMNRLSALFLVEFTEFTQRHDLCQTARRGFHRDARRGEQARQLPGRQGGRGSQVIPGRRGRAGLGKMGGGSCRAAHKGTYIRVRSSQPRATYINPLSCVTPPLADSLRDRSDG